MWTELIFKLQSSCYKVPSVVNIHQCWWTVIWIRWISLYQWNWSWVGGTGWGELSIQEYSQYETEVEHFYEVYNMYFVGIFEYFFNLFVWYFNMHFWDPFSVKIRLNYVKDSSVAYFLCKVLLTLEVYL
jgi:hypothetical protein